MQAKIEKAQSKIKQCNERLSVLSKKCEERKLILKQEDANAPLLRLWCLRVRTLVLVPRSDDGAKQSQPLEDGSLSWAMQKAIEEARKLNISELVDVTVLVNSFRCMCWCILATEYLGRKPTFDEVDLLVSRAKDISFPEEKALRMMKGMHGRAKSWKIKVMKELAPIAGEKKCYNVSTLKELRTASEEIPMRMKEEALLTGVIEDEGARHCICGGPSDARFMLSCDKCQKWYHGPCVKMTKEKCDDVEKWICPHCSGSFSDIDHEARTIVLEELKKRSKPNVSPEAPDPSKMWPPFGLFDSQSALEILGEKCSALPDVKESDIDARIVQLSGLEPKSESILNMVHPEAEVTSDIMGESAANLSTKDVPGVNGTSFDTHIQSQSSAAVTNTVRQAAEPGNVQSSELSGANAVALAATMQQETSNDPAQADSNALDEVGEVLSAGDRPFTMNGENDDEGETNESTAIAEKAIPEGKEESLSAMEIEPSHPVLESENSPVVMEIEDNHQEEKQSVEPRRESQDDQQATLPAPTATGLASSHISEVKHSASPVPPTAEIHGRSESNETPFAVVSESNADTGTTPPAVMSSAEVPLAGEETASNVEVLEMSQNGVTDTNGAERSASPQNTQAAMNIDSEAPPSLNCDSEEASAIQSDDIRLSPSAQLNGATMNVMVPALPVQDSGN